MGQTSQNQLTLKGVRLLWIYSLFVTALYGVGDGNSVFQALGGSSGGGRGKKTTTSRDDGRTKPESKPTIIESGDEPSETEAELINRLIDENSKLLRDLDASTDEAIRIQEENEVLRDELDRVNFGQAKNSSNIAKIETQAIPNADFGKLIERTDMIQGVFDILVRPGKSQNIPLLYGTQGVGKTALFSLIKKAIEKKQFPNIPKYESKLSGRQFIEVSPKLFPKHLKEDQIHAQLNSLIEQIGSGDQTKILLIDDADLISASVLSGIIKAGQDAGTPTIVTASESGRGTLQSIEILRGAFVPTPLTDFNEEQLLEALKRNVVADLIKEFTPKAVPNPHISDEAIALAVNLGPEFYPGLSRLLAAKLFLTDTIVMESRNPKTSMQIDKGSIQRFLETRDPRTVHPLMGDRFRAFLEEKNSILKSAIVGQDPIVDALTELWSEISRGNTPKSQIKFVVAAGHLGSGVLDLGEKFADEVLGSKDRVMSIDGRGFKEEKDIWTLFGTGAGFKGMENAGGTIGKHARGKGAGRSIYVIKNPQPVLLEKLTTIAQTGFYDDNQGQPVHLGKALFLIVTDKGVDKIFPPGNGVRMSDADLQRNLDRITPDAIRKMAQEPPLNNLHDDSGKWPDGFLNLVARYLTTIPPKAGDGIKVAKNEAARITAELRKQGYKIDFPDAALRTLVDAVYDQSTGIGTLQSSVQRALSDAVNALNLAEKKHVGASNEAVSITTELDIATDLPYFKLESKNGAERLPTQITMPKSSNPGSDPAFRKKIDTLAVATKANVFGQDVAIDRIAGAIRAKFYEATDPKPWIGIAFGPTGNGKTETPLTMSNHLYGEDSLEPVLLTQFKNTDMIDEYFGKGGRAGGFQRLLEKHPQGCFTLFDEMGNMPQHLKEHFMANLYDIGDKGIFTTPEGKSYSLRNYQFMFASNELQEEVIHLPDDATKMARWEVVKNSEYMSKALLKLGYTQAMLGRIGGDNLFYYKPLVYNEPEMVAEKLLIKRIRKMAAGRGFGDVSFQEGFAKAAAEIFFTHSEGGRSLRNVADNKLSPILTDVDAKISDFLDTIPVASQRKKHKSNTKLEVSLSDNYRGLFSFSGDFPPERKVTFKFVVEEPGKKSETFEAEVQAPTKKLLSQSEMERIALHQAAVAVVNNPVKTGQKVKFVTLKPTGDNLGYTLFGENQNQVKSMTRDMVVNRIAVQLAGIEAREQHGDEDSAGIKEDIIKAHEIARDAVVVKGIVSKPQGLTMRATVKAMFYGNPVDSNEEAVDPDSQIKKLLQDGEEMAKELVSSNRQQIESLKQALLKSSTGSVDGPRVAEIRAEPVSLRAVCTTAFGEVTEAVRAAVAAAK